MGTQENASWDSLEKGTVWVRPPNLLGLFNPHFEHRL